MLLNLAARNPALPEGVLRFEGEPGTVSAEPACEIPRHKIVVAEVGI
jgi:hypothetical protein